MKKPFIITSTITIIALLFIASCDLIPTGNKTNKEMPAADAKVEIRAANQEITSSMEQMMESPGVVSLTYLMELMGEFKSKGLKSSKLLKQRFTYSSFLNLFRDEVTLKSASFFDDDDDFMMGIFEYNFTYNDFDLIQESSTMLQISYPGDDLAYANRRNNTVLTVSSLQFQSVQSYDEYYDYYSNTWVQEETTERVPTRASVTLKVDNITQLSANYNASYNSDGLPLSMSASMETGDYSFSMSFSGSNTNYTTKMSYKFGRDELMAYDVKVKYTSDMESLETISGYYTAAPLKLDGSINFDAIDQHMEERGDNPDISYVNNQISIDVVHTEQKAKIGHIEFRMVYDSYWDDYDMIPVIVYNDGSYELFDDIFGMEIF